MHLYNRTRFVCRSERKLVQAGHAEPEKVTIVGYFFLILKKDFIVMFTPTEVFIPLFSEAKITELGVLSEKNRTQ